MSERFDPAAHDKHAATPREAAPADRDLHAKLEAGLIGSFPASDPVSATKPAASKPVGPAAGWVALGQGRGDVSLASPSIQPADQFGSHPMAGEFDKEFDHAANDSPRSGSSGRVTPLMWAAIVVAIVAAAIWLALKA